MSPHSSDLVTAVGAGGAATAPWWMHYLIEISPLLSFVAQVLGIIWLLTLIYHKWFRPGSPG